jgi:hypothetical protein
LIGLSGGLFLAAPISTIEAIGAVAIPSAVVWLSRTEY